MKKNDLKRSIVLFIALLFAGSVSAQGIKDLRINEVLVRNVNDVIDSHGDHSGWIELHNTGFSTVNVAGCYLTITQPVVGEDGIPRVNMAEYEKKTYRIPKEAGYMMDIPPQGYMVFYAGGKSSYSPHNTSFKIDETEYIALWDSSGRELIHEMTYDLDKQLEDVSILRVGLDAQGKEIWKYCYEPTPGQSNKVAPAISPAEEMKARDPFGLIMTLTAMSVVFLALIVLYLVFRTVGKIMQRRDKKKEVVSTPAVIAEPAKPAMVDKIKGDMSGEVAAAIVFAIKTYYDEIEAAEQMELTLRKIARVYSPWSSKIHGLTQTPERTKR